MGLLPIRLTVICREQPVACQRAERASDCIKSWRSGLRRTTRRPTPVSRRTAFGNRCSRRRTTGRAARQGCRQEVRRVGRRDPTAVAAVPPPTERCPSRRKAKARNREVTIRCKPFPGCLRSLQDATSRAYLLSALRDHHLGNNHRTRNNGEPMVGRVSLVASAVVSSDSTVLASRSGARWRRETRDVHRTSPSPYPPVTAASTVVIGFGIGARQWRRCVRG